jgi:hypothetical protein
MSTRMGSLCIFVSGDIGSECQYLSRTLRSQFQDDKINIRIGSIEDQRPREMYLNQSPRLTSSCISLLWKSRISINLCHRSANSFNL